MSASQKHLADSVVAALKERFPTIPVAYLESVANPKICHVYEKCVESIKNVDEALQKIKKMITEEVPTPEKDDAKYTPFCRTVFTFPEPIKVDDYNNDQHAIEWITAKCGGLFEALRIALSYYNQCDAFPYHIKMQLSGGQTSEYTFSNSYGGPVRTCLAYVAPGCNKTTLDLLFVKKTIETKPPPIFW